MAEKILQTRIQLKYDTETNWNKATNFIPKAGEIILYSDGGGTGIPKMKVGDGSTKVGNLKFLKGDGEYLTSVPAGTWAWTDGTSAGPTAKLTIDSNETAIAAIPAASQNYSGIITTTSQTISGNKAVLGNFSVGSRTDANLYALNISRQSTSDASSMMLQGYINETANNFQMCIYRYGTNNTEAWRLILNFLNGTITSDSTTPITLGSADIPWTAVYAEKFIGGEATTSVAGLMSAADKAILDGLSAVFGGSSSSSAGTKGLVPAPASGQQNYVLRGNGSWSQSVVSTTATLTASGWSSSTPHTQTISVSGITTSSKVVIDVNLSGQSSNSISSILKDWSNVNDIQTGSGTLTAYCYGDVPTVNLPINIIDIK